MPINFIDALAFDPSNTNTFYVGGPDGVAKTTNGGATWKLQNSGLPVTFVESLTIDPTNPTTIYAGMMGGGVSKSTDGGATWH